MSKIGHNSKPTPSVSALTEADREAIRDAVNELSDSFLMVSAEQQRQRDIINQIEEKFQIPKKLLRKMAKVYFSAGFMDQVEEQKEFEDMYQAIVRDAE